MIALIKPGLLTAGLAACVMIWLGTAPNAARPDPAHPQYALEPPPSALHCGISEDEPRRLPLVGQYLPPQPRPERQAAVQGRTV